MIQTLQPGASEAEIQALETALSINLPEDVKLSYRIHNGQFNNDDGLIDGCEFLCLQRIQEEWMIWKELLDDNTFADTYSDPQPGIKNDWWNVLWIPLTYDGSGNHYCLDLDPAQGGNFGQIITMWHDDSERAIVAPSFRDWLTDYIAGLESGERTFSE